MESSISNSTHQVNLGASTIATAQGEIKLAPNTDVRQHASSSGAGASLFRLTKRRGITSLGLRPHPDLLPSNGLAIRTSSIVATRSSALQLLGSFIYKATSASLVRCALGSCASTTRGVIGKP